MNPPDLSRENRKIIKNWSADFSRALPRVLCGGKTLKIPSPLNWWILEVWIDDLFAKGKCSLSLSLSMQYKAN